MKEYNKKLNLSMKVYCKNVHLNFVNKNITDYKINEIYDLISKDVIRNEIVIKDVEKEFKNRKSVLVLTERINHLEYLYEKLSEITSNIIVYRGGLGKKILKKYDEMNLNIKEKNENKKEILVYDYVDDNFSMIRNMFLKRKKAYKKVGYEIIENNC